MCILLKTSKDIPKLLVLGNVLWQYYEFLRKPYNQVLIIRGTKLKRISFFLFSFFSPFCFTLFPCCVFTK